MVRRIFSRAEENLAKIQKPCKDGGNKDFQTAELPG